MGNHRTVEIFQSDKWNRIDSDALKNGNVFRMFEPDGECVTDSEGNTVFIATSDVYKTLDGINQIDYRCVQII